MEHLYLAGQQEALASTTTTNAYAAPDTILRDNLPGSEPAELVKEVVLNPQPDLHAVPVEVGQGIMDGTIMQYGDWKRG